ncbi:histidine-rich protein PFHRP-II [Drosophila obscura]|uniref:histidine-rich protein PFHRP-II n=1 Tax=Drosophila obscura TaxID=7282 RepID=UPI001BB2BB4D|nr:histidine-rich protein PFHRP-II [Drosophila obscura]
MACLILLLSALCVLAQGTHLSHVGHGSFPEAHGHGHVSVGREYLPVEHGIPIPIGHGSSHHYGLEAPHAHHLPLAGLGFPQHHGHIIAHDSVSAQHLPESYHQLASPGASIYHHDHHHHHGGSASILAGTGHAHVHHNRNCHATIQCPNSVSPTYASDGHYCYKLNNPCDLAIANCKRRNELKSVLRHISHGECHHLPRSQIPY